MKYYQFTTDYICVLFEFIEFNKLFMLYIPLADFNTIDVGLLKKSHYLRRRSSKELQCQLLIFYFLVALRPSVSYGFFIREVSRSHTATHHSLQDSSGRMISSSQKPLQENTQHSHERERPMPPAVFEPTISAGQLSQTYTSDLAANETDNQ